MMISLSSEELTPIQLGVLARWTIVPRLTGVPGVSNVVIWGQKERQLQVLVDPERLARSGVTLDQVISTTGNALWASPLTFLEASTPGTGGFIDQNNQRLGVQHLSPIKTADELARVAIEGSGAPGATNASGTAPLRLGDVADVVEDHQALIGDAVVNGGDGLILVVEKLPDTSTTAVTAGVEDALESMEAGLDGVVVDTGIYRPATYLEDAGSNLVRSVVIGAILLVVGLAAFLFSWRRALISLVAIAFSLLAATAVLYLREATFNAVVIAGLVMAVAAVVDDATSGVERMGRRLRDGADGDAPAAGSPSALVLAAALETARTLGFALAALVVALLPVFVLEGLAGDSFYPPLAISFLIAVVVSMLVAVTVTPALALVLLPRAAGREQDSPVVRGLRGACLRLLTPLGRTPIPSLLAGAAVILLGVASFMALDRSVLPPLKETDLLIAWNGPPGASLPEMDRITARAAEELRRLEGVRNVDAHVGRAIHGDLVGGASTGEIWVSLESGAPYRSTVGAVEDVVNGYPGLDRKVLTYSQNRMSEVLASEQTPVRVRLYGQDLGVLQGKAAEVGQVLSGIDGARDVRVQRIVTEPTIEIEVDLPKAQAAGIKPGDVRRAATTLVSGIQVGALFEEQKIFEVQVWGRPEVRRSVSDVRNLLLDLPDGGHVTLGEVADVRIGSSPTSIDHDATSRSLDVTAAVSGRSRGAVVDDLQQRMDGIGFPLEYHAEVLGDYADKTGAERKLAAFAVGAAIGIFLLLQAAFASWRLALAGFAGLGVAVSGAFVAAWIDGGHLTLATVAGALAVLALAVRQVIDLFARAQSLERDEGRPLSRDLVQRVAAERCGPVVTTVGVTALALLPIVIAGSIAGQEIVKPLAVAVLGGLVTCTIAVLFVLPPIYLRTAPRRPDDVHALSAHDPVPAAEQVAVETVGTAQSWPGPPAATTSEG